MCLESAECLLCARCLTFVKLFHLPVEARRLFPFRGGPGWGFPVLPHGCGSFLSPPPPLRLGLCLSCCPRTSRRRAASAWGPAHPCCSGRAGCLRDVSETRDVGYRTWVSRKPLLPSQHGPYRLYDLGQALDSPWPQFLHFKMGVTIPTS